MAGSANSELREEELSAIERSLHGKLRAHRVSREFIRRFGEDALQQGLTEYARAVCNGAQINNRDAWIVRASFCRAIDELRREAHQVDGAEIDALMEIEGDAAPPTEEIAVEHVLAEELREALKRLSPEEQCVLSLYYFEGLTTEASAKALLCSDRTYRRRLERALEKLGQLLGAPAPEPGSQLAIEIGLLAWVALRGARVVLPTHPLEQLAAAADGLREGAAYLARQLRELASRPFVGEAAEKAGALAGGPAGKLAGSCASALALCTLTGAIGPGVGGVDVIGAARERVASKSQAQLPANATEREEDPATAATSLPERAPTTQALSEPAESPAGSASQHQTKRRADRRQVRRQTYGFARAGKESSPSPAVRTDSSAGEEAEVSAEPAPGEASAPATEAEQAEQEFGAFK
jgi:RNA polymerase sigma factor (sigma-70 family)